MTLNVIFDVKKIQLYVDVFFTLISLTAFELAVTFCLNVKRHEIELTFRTLENSPRFTSGPIESCYWLYWWIDCSSWKFIR